MKKAIIVFVFVVPTAGFAQKSRLDYFYKTKQTVHSVSLTASSIVSKKEAMKRDVVKYNQAFQFATAEVNFSAFSPKEKMKRVVVKIDENPRLRRARKLTVHNI
ncbi:hypothetical protein [Parafilimonas sp.]|uniref:hypothetical protein n=1 Tax=Parafilimonas sp. TaxID=1969739 RepID=UPI0039E6CF5F